MSAGQRSNHAVHLGSTEYCDNVSHKYLPLPNFFISCVFFLRVTYAHNSSYFKQKTTKSCKVSQAFQNCKLILISLFLLINSTDFVQLLMVILYSHIEKLQVCINIYKLPLKKLLAMTLRFGPLGKRVAPKSTDYSGNVTHQSKHNKQAKKSVLGLHQIFIEAIVPKRKQFLLCLKPKYRV